MISHGEEEQPIFIAILNQGNMRPELANLLIHISHTSRVSIHYPNARPITHNRNSIVKQFLTSDAGNLLMIDSDIVPKFDPTTLQHSGKDIIGAPCPQWNEGDIYWVVMDRVEAGYKPVPPERRCSLTRVDAIGTGCIMIKRHVLESMRAPFSELTDAEGRLQLGEDFNFCRLAGEHGFEVWCDWNVRCSHFKTVDLDQVWELKSC